MLNCVYFSCLRGRTDWHSLAARGEYNDPALLCLLVYVFIDMFIFAAHGLVSHRVQRNEAHRSGQRPPRGPETHVRHGEHVPLPLHRLPGAG